MKFNPDSTLFYALITEHFTIKKAADNYCQRLYIFTTYCLKKEGIKPTKKTLISLPFSSHPLSYFILLSPVFSLLSPNYLYSMKFGQFCSYFSFHFVG
jgi:hypothetical protein